MKFAFTLFAFSSLVVAGFAAPTNNLNQIIVNDAADLVRDVADFKTFVNNTIQGTGSGNPQADVQPIIKKIQDDLDKGIEHAQDFKGQLEQGDGMTLYAIVDQLQNWVSSTVDLVLTKKDDLQKYADSVSDCVHDLQKRVDKYFDNLKDIIPDEQRDRAIKSMTKTEKDISRVSNALHDSDHDHDHDQK